MYPLRQAEVWFSADSGYRLPTAIVVAALHPFRHDDQRSDQWRSSLKAYWSLKHATQPNACSIFFQRRRMMSKEANQSLPLYWSGYDSLQTSRNTGTSAFSRLCSQAKRMSNSRYTAYQLFVLVLLGLLTLSPRPSLAEMFVQQRNATTGDMEWAILHEEGKKTMIGLINRSYHADVTAWFPTSAIHECIAPVRWREGFLASTSWQSIMSAIFCRAARGQWTPV